MNVEDVRDRVAKVQQMLLPELLTGKLHTPAELVDTWKRAEEIAKPRVAFADWRAYRDFMKSKSAQREARLGQGRSDGRTLARRGRGERRRNAA